MDVNETHILKDMTLPFVFHNTRMKGSKPPSPRNWHENIELLYCKEGTGRVLCGDESIPFHAGETVVVNANRAHTVIAECELLHYYCLIVDRGFCRSNGIDTNALFFDTLVRDDIIGRAMETIREEYATPDRPFRTAVIRTAVSSILVVLCREHSTPAPLSQGQPNLLSCIQKAIGYIRLEYAKDLSLDDIAARVGLSKYYFSREFRRITGYPFVSYVNIVRCEEAKRLLSQTQMRVGEVAAACGFANPSYFTRTFLSVTGMRPLAYREKKKQV